ncbi:MAG TPA: menaquinone biosynthesis protein [Candidatus Baltobacteraceae bacterium]|jgi:chorismate dehydratase|nr:menaquinone biosynthesis protein [Candidatus Baltobacteraceae bacterium]
MLRCSRMQYVNDLPIYAAVDAGAVSYPGTLLADVPVRLNAMMREGRLDMGPVSSFEYAVHADRYVLLPDLCIGARDEIVSVLLVSKTPPALLDGVKIATTPESASGRNLLRVLLERRYGVRAEFDEAADPLANARRGQPAMVIGDAAIDATFEFPTEQVYDLGALWRAWSGEQSVTAVWVARREIFEQQLDGVRACLHALTDAYSWGRANPDAVIAQAQRIKPRPAGFYEIYYGKLNFSFHSAAQRGLSTYCKELHAIGAIDRVPPCVPEVIGVAQ